MYALGSGARGKVVVCSDLGGRADLSPHKWFQADRYRSWYRFATGGSIVSLCRSDSGGNDDRGFCFVCGFQAEKVALAGEVVVGGVSGSGFMKSSSQ